MGPASRRVPRVFVYTERTVDGMGKYCTKKRDQLCHPGSFDSAQDKLHAARRAVEGSRQGFTLMELMVYIAIVGIVVIVAGQAFSNSTKMRVRTQSMLKASEVAENVAAILKEDIAQTGAKSSQESGTPAAGASKGVKFISVCQGTNTEDCISKKIYVDPDNATNENKDSSSFQITNQVENIDDVTLLRVRYDSDGSYLGVEKIEWTVSNRVLYRSCKVIAKKDGWDVPEGDPCGDGEDSTPNQVEMATGVEKFHVIAASPSSTVDAEQVFPPCAATPCPDEFRLVPRTGEFGYATIKADAEDGENVGADKIQISQFFSNYDNQGGKIIENISDRNMNQLIAIESVSGELSGNWKDICINNHGNISLLNDQEYEISFEVPFPGDDDKSLLFVPGEDHMAIGFRSAADGDLLKEGDKVLLQDFMFFPPMNAQGSGLRHMRFSVPKNINNACLALTFAMYSPLAHMGKISIKNLKVKKVATAGYNFETPISMTDYQNKKNVKALRVDLKVVRNGEGGEMSLIIPIASNGPRD